MNLFEIILMFVCYIPILLICVNYIANKLIEGNWSYLWLLIPLIVLAIGLFNIEHTDTKVQADKGKYEQVTETFYRKIK